MVSGDLLFLSGCVSWDENGKVLGVGDMAAQIRNSYRDIEATLSAHGATFANVVKETVYTRDMDALVKHAAVRADFYGKTSPPAATWVQIDRLVAADLLLEIEVLARLG